MVRRIGYTGLVVGGLAWFTATIGALAGWNPAGMAYLGFVLGGLLWTGLATWLLFCVWREAPESRPPWSPRR